MAICNGLPGVQVTVTVSGHDLQEYRNEEENEDDGRTTTRYIEAKSGQTFEVSYSVDRHFNFVGDTVAFYEHVDGHLMSAPLLFISDAPYSGSSLGRKEKDGRLRRYQFASLEVGQ